MLGGHLGVFERGEGNKMLWAYQDESQPVVNCYVICMQLVTIRGLLVHWAQPGTEIANQQSILKAELTSERPQA